MFGRTPAPCPMPTDVRDNALVRIIASEHGVTQVAIADATGWDESYISRIFNGQYAPPVQITRLLWKLTGDERLIELALGVGSEDLLPRTQVDRRVKMLRDQLNAVQNNVRVALSALPIEAAPARLDLSA